MGRLFGPSSRRLCNILYSMVIRPSPCGASTFSLPIIPACPLSHTSSRVLLFITCSSTFVVHLNTCAIQQPFSSQTQGYRQGLLSHWSKSRIIFLPFINANPGDYDTIYTALLQASNKCIEQQQKVCFVTFDQPLYHKARDIVASCTLNNDSCQVIIRLGGFHLLIIVFAASSVDKMLNGYAYGRAVRAHQLIHLALAKIVLSKTDLTEEDRVIMEDILLVPEQILDKSESEVLQSIADKFTETISRLKNYGCTAKLWVQYFKMVTLMKNFIHAERMGNWALHLKTI
ncbi:hypothetical protein RI129_008843 [Pyrocoelia pectoralis]|uniref:Uncharacterized protein n=1 Tax=Pyrocoelia pectoralis TaxID=417401 RepID=A0AAN7VCQ0_9COLE